MSQSKLAIPLSAILAAVLIHTLWGANPVAVKLGLEVFPPFWTGFFRFFLGVVVLLFWARWKRVRILPGRGEWGLLAILSAAFTAQILVMNYGYSLTSGAVGAVVTATYPLFTALFAHYFLAHDHLPLHRALGLLLAFSGVSIIILRDVDLDAVGFAGLGSLVVLLSAIMLAARSVYTAHLVRKIDPVRVVVWQMILSLPVFALGGWALETIRWENMAFAPVAGIVYQGVIVAGLNFMVNAYLVQRYPPSLMTGFGFISPVSGVLLSLLLLGDSLNTELIIGTAVVAAGLIILARKGKENT